MRLAAENGAGHKLGHKVGHKPGHNMGHNVGHNAGHNMGHKVGRNAGHKPGHKVGHKAGQKPGHKTGHKLGHKVGHKLGHKVGHKLGHKVGHKVGHKLGHKVGQKLGHKVGQKLGQNLPPTTPGLGMRNLAHVTLAVNRCLPALWTVTGRPKTALSLPDRRHYIWYRWGRVTTILPPAPRPGDRLGGCNRRQNRSKVKGQNASFKMGNTEPHYDADNGWYDFLENPA